ncbi:MAG: hypothetical protein WA925_28320 [Mycobacterium sp.]
MSGFQSARQAHPDGQHLTDGERSTAPDPGVHRIPTVVRHHDVGTPGGGSAALEHRHDVRVPGDPSHRPLLAIKGFEVNLVLIETEHLHRDDSIE